MVKKSPTEIVRRWKENKGRRVRSSDGDDEEEEEGGGDRDEDGDVEMVEGAEKKEEDVSWDTIGQTSLRWVKTLNLVSYFVFLRVFFISKQIVFCAHRSTRKPYTPLLLAIPWLECREISEVFLF